MKRNGIMVYPTEEISDTILEMMDVDTVRANMDKTYQIFSKKTLIEDWRKIFND